jgi:hydrogenase maturation protease
LIASRRKPLSAEADRFKDKETNGDRHKGTEGQIGTAFLLCAFAALSLRNSADDKVKSRGFDPPSQEGQKAMSESLDLEAIAGFLQPPFSCRTAVIGVGNKLWGDDGAGPELLKRLTEEWALRETPSNAEGRCFFIDAGDFPEDWLIRVADLAPDMILVIDAMELHAEPGSMAVLELDALPDPVCTSAHRLPLRTLLRLWEERGSKAFVLGIQPKDRMFREGLSPEVQMSIDSLARFLFRTPCAEGLNQRGARRGLVQKSLVPGVHPEVSKGNAGFHEISAFEKVKNMKKTKIVTIDDDPDILDVLRIALEANNYEVHAASSGAEGLKVIKQVRPDLIILDVMMDTVTEGFHVSYELRNQDPRSEYHEFNKVPIIMLTSISQKTGMTFSPEKDGEYLPIDEFVEKPLRVEFLLEMVKKLLTR